MANKKDSTELKVETKTEKKIKKPKAPKILEYFCSFKDFAGEDNFSTVIAAENEDAAKALFCEKVSRSVSSFFLLYSLPSLREEILSCVFVQDLSCAESSFLKSAEDIKAILLKMLSDGHACGAEKYNIVRDSYENLNSSIYSSGLHYSERLLSEMRLLSGLLDNLRTYMRD